MRRPYKHIDLNDKFSDFEHTPEDSSWNTISGGINSRQSAGSLSEKMDELSIKPSSAVWSGIADQAHPNRKKKVILWWTYGAAASIISTVLLVSIIFSTATEATIAYTPRDVHSDEISSWDKYYSNEEGSLIAPDSQIGLMDNSEETANEFHSDKFPKSNSLANDFKSRNNTWIANQPNNNTGAEKSTLDNIEDHIQQVIQEGDVLYSSIPEENKPHMIFSSSEDTLVTFRVTKLRIEPRYNYNFSKVDLKDRLAVSAFPFWVMSEGDNARHNKKPTATSLLAMTQLNQSNSADTDGISYLSSATPETINDGSDLTFSSADISSNELLTKEKFSTPLYFSLNLEKELTLGKRNKWSLGSGLGYLLMRSSITYETEEITSVTDITRNYIAVPLYLKYDFIKKPRWSTYASLGTSAELGLGGKAETNDFRNDELENSSSSRFNLGVGQFNVNTSIGFNVKLGTHITAFSEASMAHYFYQSNYNFWSGKKLWPGLKTGISLSF